MSNGWSLDTIDTSAMKARVTPASEQVSPSEEERWSTVMVARLLCSVLRNGEERSGGGLDKSIADTNSDASRHEEDSFHLTF